MHNLGRIRQNLGSNRLECSFLAQQGIQIACEWSPQAFYLHN